MNKIASKVQLILFSSLLLLHIGCRKSQKEAKYFEEANVSNLRKDYSLLSDTIRLVFQDLDEQGFSSFLQANQFDGLAKEEKLFLDIHRCSHSDDTLGYDIAELYDLYQSFEADSNLDILFSITNAIAHRAIMESKMEVNLITHLHTLNKLFAARPTPTLRLYTDHLLSSSINVLVSENERSLYEGSIKELKQLISPEYFKTYGGIRTKALILDGNVSDGQQRLHLLDSLLAKASVARDKQYALFNLGVYYEQVGQDSLMHYYYHKACQALGATSCSIRRFFPAIYGLMQPCSPEQEQFYRSILAKVNNCPAPLIQRLKWYTKNFLTPTSDLGPVQQVDTLLAVRRLSEDIFPKQSTLHLQDYYVGNLTSIFDIYESHPNAQLKPLDLINEVLDTRLKEKYRKNRGIKITNPLRRDIYQKINEKLLAINYFRSLPPFPDPIYDELFHLYMQVEQETVDATPGSTALSALAPIQNQITQQNTSLINITKGADKYHIYTITSDEFHTSSIDAQWADSLGYLLLPQFSSPKAAIDDSKINELIRPLLQHTTTDHLTIIADGIFQLLPLGYMMNRPTDQHQHIDDFIAAQTPLHISPEATHLYSFSDPATVADRNIRQVLELGQGFEECLTIKALFGSPIIQGRQFQHHSLFENEKIDWAHVSTHAYSSPNNLLDNKIICRKGETNNTDNLYGYELSTKKHIPQVVVLSACETGRGLYRSGAGVETLSRSLLDNGAKTVLKTLWKVNEHSTRVLMEKMYGELAAGASLSEALDSAQRHTKAQPQFTHPFYWAGFVIEGQSDIYLRK